MNSLFLPEMRIATAFLAVIFYSSFAVLHADEVEAVMLASEYQNGEQEIRVLLPDNYNGAKQYPVVYVLPPQGGLKGYAKGFEVLKKMDAHNKYEFIVVTMSFEKEPWYGDHFENEKLRQASYVKEFLIPYIENKYSTFGTLEGRLLLGFSKSGWGSFSLILKYPDFFGYAASWDAPISFKTWTQPSTSRAGTYTYRGMRDNYGSAEQLSLFRPDLNITKNGKYFREKTRLVLFGHAKFRIHNDKTHYWLNNAGIKHLYNNKIKCGHKWAPIWIEPALEFMKNTIEETKNANSSSLKTQREFIGR